MDTNSRAGPVPWNSWTAQNKLHFSLVCGGFLRCFIVFWYILSFILMALWGFLKRYIQSIKLEGYRGGENLGGVEEGKKEQNMLYEKN